jgi:hypothetical protein
MEDVGVTREDLLDGLGIGDVDEVSHAHETQREEVAMAAQASIEEADRLKHEAD